MHTLILTIHIIVAFLLVLIVLIQKSKGGAVGGLGGGSMGGLFTARGSANFLTRTTAILATLFFVSALLLVIMGRQPTKSGILQSLEASHVSAQKAPDVAKKVTNDKSSPVPLS